jgi:hypothetical protein
MRNPGKSLFVALLRGRPNYLFSLSADLIRRSGRVEVKLALEIATQAAAAWLRCGWRSLLR